MLKRDSTHISEYTGKVAVSPQAIEAYSLPPMILVSFSIIDGGIPKEFAVVLDFTPSAKV